MKIAVVTMWGDNYKPVADVTLPIMKRYADKHGYDFYEVKLKDESKWPYKKHECFKDMAKFADVLFYIDIDCAITNHQIKVESFLDNEHDLFITEDKNELNGGSLFLKTTEEGMRVNYWVLSLRGIFENEQNAMVYLMGDPLFNQYVRMLPHPSINSYLYELYPEFGKLTPEEGQWEEGQFILHTPAIPIDKRAEILSQAKIIE